MTRLLSLMILTLVFFNTSNAQVKSDYDKSVDFTKYHTYTFLGWQKESDSIVNDIDKKRILDALQSELSKRGLTLDQDNGDAALSVYIVVTNEKQTTAYTDYMGGMGYRGGFGWGMGAMGGGMATTTYSEDDYQQGTFVIDLYDGASKKLVWQGVMTSVVKDNPQKREKTIPSKMAKLMKKYPIKPTK